MGYFYYVLLTFWNLKALEAWISFLELQKSLWNPFFRDGQKSHEGEELIAQFLG